MPQTTIINSGTWGSLAFPKEETSVVAVQSCKWKAARERVNRKKVANKAIGKISWRNPTMVITLEVETITQSGLGSLAVGRAPAATLNNFDAAWREHDPAEGVVVLTDVEDSSDVNADVPLSSTMTFEHNPFVV